jgi:hypothetical protein
MVKASIRHVRFTGSHGVRLRCVSFMHDCDAQYWSANRVGRGVEFAMT